MDPPPPGIGIGVGCNVSDIADKGKDVGIETPGTVDLAKKEPELE